MKKRLGGWCEMAAGLGLSRVVKLRGSSARAAVTRGPECGKLRNFTVVNLLPRKRLVEPVIEVGH
jgi:hypothetical protein